MVPSVYAVATMDTKGHELAYVAERLRAANVSVVTVDVGTLEPPVVHPDVDRATIGDCHPTDDGRRLALAAQNDRGPMSQQWARRWKSTSAASMTRGESQE